MKKRTIRRHSSHRKSRSRSSYYIAIVTLMLVLAFAGKNVYESEVGGKVLGKSIFLAQDAPPPAPPSDGGGGSNPPPQEQPKQESQPQQQQPQNNPPPQQPPQEQQNQQPQNQPPPQQNSAAPQNQQPFQQPNQQFSEQRSGQGQFRPLEQPRGEQSPNAPQRGNERGPFQPQQNQQNQQRNDQRGPEGQNAGSRTGPPISAEQRQQFEQQFREEATKNGFQFEGQLPERFQQFRQAQQSGEPGSPNSGPGSQNQGPSNQRGPFQFQALPSIQDFPTLTGRFEVQTGDNGPNINLNDADTRIQLGGQRGQNANFELKARRPDGTEVQIDKAAFEKINAAMQVVTGAQIEQSGERTLWKRGDVAAHASLPLSFNLATKTFTVQTSAGEKELSVLPDQAVAKLIENKVISQVVEGAEGEASGVELKEFENKPVFAVKGTKQKKFLFFVPVTVSKTSLVSAETGEVVNTDQGLVSTVLETISF